MIARHRCVSIPYCFARYVELQKDSAAKSHTKTNNKKQTHPSLLKRNFILYFHTIFITRIFQQLYQQERFPLFEQHFLSSMINSASISIGLAVGSEEHLDF